jgi:ABC-type microcin C transport system duplicated ATPase subunit YejF
MSFQDPSASLNPRMRVRDIMMEPLIYNNIAKGNDALEMIRNTLKLVGLHEHHMNRYPHSFSGGSGNGLGSRGRWYAIQN